METVTISPKFQFVIPQKVREAMGLRARDIRPLRGCLKGMDTSFVREGDRV
jgi:hypothetical protein